MNVNLGVSPGYRPGIAQASCKKKSSNLLLTACRLQNNVNAQAPVMLLESTFLAVAFPVCFISPLRNKTTEHPKHSHAVPLYNSLFHVTSKYSLALAFTMRLRENAVI